MEDVAGAGSRRLPAERLSVLVADRHRLLCGMLEIFFARLGSFEIVGVVSSTEQAIIAVRILQPRILLLGTDTPMLDVIGTAEATHACCNGTRIILLSARAGSREIELARRVRAAGHVLTTDTPQGLVNAMLLVAAGGEYRSPERRCGGTRHAHYSEFAPDSPLCALTERELEILCYLADGLGNKEIASVAGISVKTVARHIENMAAKIGVHGRVGLACLAIRQGLISR